MSDLINSLLSIVLPTSCPSSPKKITSPKFPNMSILSFLLLKNPSSELSSKDDIKNLNELIEHLVCIFDNYKDFDLEISNDFLEQLNVISNEIKSHIIANANEEEDYDFHVEKFVEALEFVFLMDKLCVIVIFHSKYMTENDGDKDTILVIRDKLRGYLLSLKSLTDKLILKIYELKKHSSIITGDAIINTLKEEKHNAKKFFKESIFNKEDLDLGHDNLITLKNPVEIVDNNHDIRIRKKKIYKNELVAEQEIGLLQNKIDVEKLENELVKLKSFDKCQNIQKYYGYTHTHTHDQDHSKTYYLITNWFDYNLKTYLETNSSISWNLKVKIAHGIAEALDYCHKRNTFHRNIKTTSVLLDSSLNPILCNFGTAGYENPILFKSTKYEQDPRFTAPEVLKSGYSAYKRSSDIYSFSMLLWAITMQKEPFSEYDFIKNGDLIKQKVLNDNKRPEPSDIDKIEGIPDGYSKIMKQGWHSDIERRPKIGEIYKILTKINQSFTTHYKNNNDNVSSNISSSTSSEYDLTYTSSPLQSSSSSSHSSANLPSIIISEAAAPSDDESDASSIFELELSTATPSSTLLAINIFDENNECDEKTLVNSSSSSVISFVSDDDASIITDEFSDDGYYSSCSEVSSKNDSQKQTIKNEINSDDNTLKPSSFIRQKHHHRGHRNHAIKDDDKSKLREISKYHSLGKYQKAWEIIEKYDSDHATPESKYWAGLYYMNNYNMKGRIYEDKDQKNKEKLQNQKKANEKLSEASELNHPVAQFAFANAIIEGRVKIEEERRFQYGRELLEKSAENNYRRAINRIAKYKREGLYGYERTRSVCLEQKPLEIKSGNKKRVNSLKRKKSHVADNPSRLPTICNGNVSKITTTFPVQSSSPLTPAAQSKIPLSSAATVRSKIPVKQTPPSSSSSSPSSSSPSSSQIPRLIKY